MQNRVKPRREATREIAFVFPPPLPLPARVMTHVVEDIDRSMLPRLDAADLRRRVANKLDLTPMEVAA